ncbi:DUF485 domain-containing protein [Methylobacterium sp. B4]|uniref:DUF485 domain-containing protein n=1 Tax=Methylobacterium sp. B4 TaxID=1938755 RepID=UPI000D77562B|nr:DUF485 domain-containing protein [Methylobacterium sp. B4]PXW52399.1 uncharacterized membrane protein (DUF485 family) [Methylobacterium sp. B4]
MSVTQTAGSSATADARTHHGNGALEMPEPDHRLDRIADHPIFKTLVHDRTRFGWILTGLMLFVYFGFIGLIAFDKALLATKVGGTASLGFYMGMFVIVFAFVLTGIYVARANTRYDRLSAELIRSLAK